MATAAASLPCPVLNCTPLPSPAGWSGAVSVLTPRHASQLCPAAETAITIDDVVVVVNSGRLKEKSYDPYTNVSTLMVCVARGASVSTLRGHLPVWVGGCIEAGCPALPAGMPATARQGAPQLRGRCQTGTH